MYGEFRDANTQNNFSLAFERFREVSRNFGITIGYMRLVKIKFIGTILN